MNAFARPGAGERGSRGALRLTTSQALVRWLLAQRSETVDGREAALFPGVFAIFGHGNVLGIGTALEEHRDDLPVWRGHTEQGMGLAAVGYAKATQRRQVGVVTSSIGPGALNLVTAAGVAHANRLPLLLLPGDTFAGRAPDPVLQQVEPFHDATATVNDAFRAVSRYFDRITRPEQLLATLPQIARVLTEPADCGPVTLALPQDVQTEVFDFPETLFEPVTHRVPRPRPDRRAVTEAAAMLRASRRPLLVLGGGVRYSGAGGRALDSPSGTGFRSPRPRQAARSYRTSTRSTRGRWASPARRRRTQWPPRRTWCWPSAPGCRISPRRRGPCSHHGSGWSRSTRPPSTR